MKKMTPKERLDAVVKGVLPDRVPVHDVACITVAKAMGYEWKDVRYDAVKSAQLTVEYNRKTGSDFCFGLLETPSMFMDLPGMEVSQPDDNYGNVMNSYFVEPEDIDSKDLYDPYNPKESSWLRKGIIDKINSVREINDTGALTSGWSWGPITTAGFLRGVETFLMDTFLEPELAHKVLKKSTALVDGIMRLGSEGGDYIWLPDPTASGSLINAQTFEEFCSPYLSKVVNNWKADFEVPVIYHVCGDTIPVISGIIASGIDVLSLDHAVDIGDARKIVGDNFTLFGNVHPTTTLWKGTPSDVKRESLECIEKAGLNGRFILSGGCELTRDTSIENVRAMVDTAKEYKY